MSVYSTTANNRPGGANNESRGGPGTGFCNPGDGFLVLVAVVACHYVYYHVTTKAAPGTTKTSTRTTKTTPVFVISPHWYDC